jgi:hypothetical protein
MQKAVLFLVFNRPQTTRQVFECIRKARPERLYVAADGPRSDRPEEITLCEEVRRIATNVDWPCDLRVLFQEHNLGCCFGVSSGINWFFEHEEEGVIIEDDVVPSADFFGYCERMLELYRDDERIMMITGTNFHPIARSEDYFFSQHFSIWGWATWRRAWKQYDITMSGWPSKSRTAFLNYHFGKTISRHFINTFNLISENQFDTWDIQWVYCCVFNNGLCVTPGVNLVSNIGIVGTHSDVLTESHMLEVRMLDSNELKGPENVCVDAEYDLYLHKSKNIPALRIAAISSFLRTVGLFSVVQHLYKTVNAVYKKVSK